MNRKICPKKNKSVSEERKAEANNAAPGNGILSWSVYEDEEAKTNKGKKK